MIQYHSAKSLNFCPTGLFLNIYYSLYQSATRLRARYESHNYNWHSHYCHSSRTSPTLPVLFQFPPRGKKTKRWYSVQFLQSNPYLYSYFQPVLSSFKGNKEQGKFYKVLLGYEHATKATIIIGSPTSVIQAALARHCPYYTNAHHVGRKLLLLHCHFLVFAQTKY